MKYRQDDNRSLSHPEIKAKKRAEAEYRKDLYDKLDIPTKIRLLDEKKLIATRQREKLNKQLNREVNEKR